VRVLFSFVGGRGHVEPLIPIAVAVRAAGHTVAFTGAHTPLRSVGALGFEVFPLGSPPAGTPPKRLPLQELDPAREERDLRERFVRRAARDRVPAILTLSADWRPDLVVCDEVDFGAAIAAERSGIPHATVLVLAAGTLARPQVVAEPLDELRAEHGLVVDPTLTMLSRYLVLSPAPPSYRDPAHPLPATTHFFRTLAEPREQPPPWLESMQAPTVLFTLGTEFNLESGDLFMRVLAGLQELPIGVIVTVGSQIDPAELGPLSATVHAERYIPQSLMLPRCSAVVSHGGSGTVLGALAHGLPQVLIPMGADQPLNARRCETLGVARVLDPVRCTPAEVREAVSAVLSEPSYGSAADVLRAEMATLPPPAHAVSLLERLAAERRPLLR